MPLYCGIDWATEHHDVAVIDGDGHRRGPRTGQQRRGRLRSIVDAAGRSRRQRHQVRSRSGSKSIAACGWPRCAQPAGRSTRSTRWRPPGTGPRYAVSGAKSDATDAVLLANIVRTDPGAHRPLPADTEAAQAIRVLARAQQDAVWARQQIGNQIRDLLKDFYPAAIVAFADLRRRVRPPRRPHHPGCGPDPGPGCQADPSAAAAVADQGRPPALPRPRRRPSACGLHRHLPAATARW